MAGRKTAPAGRRASNGRGSNGRDESGRRTESGLSKGFTPGNASELADGYFKVEPGAHAFGILLARKEREDDEGKTVGYYRLRVTREPCESAVIKGGDRVTVPVGKILHVDEKSALEGLAEVLEKHGKGKVEIEILVHGKQDIKGGRSYWDIEWGSNTNITRVPGRHAGEADEDIPF